MSVFFLPLAITVGNMKSWGLRRDSLSKYTALAASIYPLITTEAPIFYIACCTECFLILCLLYRNSIFTYSFSPFYDLKFNLFELYILRFLSVFLFLDCSVYRFLSFFLPFLPCRHTSPIWFIFCYARL